MKAYASLARSLKHSLENAGWFYVDDTGEQTDTLMSTFPSNYCWASAKTMTKSSLMPNMNWS